MEVPISALTLPQVLAFLEAADDVALSEVIEAAQEQQRERALAAGDLDALVADGFDRGFKSDGSAREPILVDGLVVCFGFKQQKSGVNHECAFAQLNGSWIWESDLKVADDGRHSAGKGGKELFRTVTVATAYDGLEIDMLWSGTQMGVHKLKETKSWVVRGGRLELTGSRKRSNAH